MRLTPFIATLASVLMASPSWSADAIISAGEHATYSRIVLAKAAGEVRVEQSGRLVRLHHESDAILNLTDINIKNKAHRIAKAAQARDAQSRFVELTLNCDCDIRTRRLSNGKFVLDVFDRSPTTVLAQPANGAPLKGDEPAPSSDSETDIDRMTVEQAHERMASLLQQAAASGLVSIRNDEAGEAFLDNMEASPSLAEKKQMGAEKDKSISSRITVSSKDIAACYSDKTMTIASEEFDDEPLVRISELKIELAAAPIGEGQDIAIKLANGFLSIGFGDEAHALLKEYGVIGTPASDIARLIAERPLDEGSSFMEAKGCIGAHALWQAVAAPADDAAGLIKQAGKAIETLPMRLKPSIAARLAVKLTEAKEWKLARRYIEIAQDAPDMAGGALAFAEAKMKEYKGDIEGSREALLDIASENNPSSKDALLALAESYKKGNAATHDGFIEDLGALLKIDGVTEAALHEALAWANLGNIEAAMMLLKAQLKRTPEAEEGIRRTAYEVFQRAFTDIEPLNQISALHALLENDDWLKVADHKPEWLALAADVAEDAGVPNLAFDLLTAAPAGETNQDFAKAAAALAANDPDKTIELAAPHSDEEAFGELIVRAHLQKNRNFEALASAATLDSDVARNALTAKAAWRARNWQAVSDAYGEMDPSRLDTEEAVQFALSAYEAKSGALPPAADAVLSSEEETLAAGLRSLFEPSALGQKEGATALERSQAIVKHTKDEIRMFEELLNDG